MPPRSPAGQADGLPDPRLRWFDSAPGRAILDSESASIQAALAEHHGRPWLWLSPVATGAGNPPGRGLRLHVGDHGWLGSVHCAFPLPLPGESMATVVIQHVAVAGRRGQPLLDECARVLVPGGTCWLYALNPVSPYRWRWQGQGVSATEPMPWRWRLRAAQLQPDAVSHGLGPRWRVAPDGGLQPGPGIRAAYVLRAEKRACPLTPMRAAASLRLGEGVPAA